MFEIRIVPETVVRARVRNGQIACDGDLTLARMVRKLDCELALRSCVGSKCGLSHESDAAVSKRYCD